ncbi:MAG: hypothetical protein LBQ43_01735 [Holosporales bacterium]|jgi:hypothetical protein|nr:hypothetical protein [Holosporales bacterium]
MLLKVSKVTFSLIFVGPLCMGAGTTQKLIQQAKDAMYEVLDEDHWAPPTESPHASTSIQDALGLTQTDIEEHGSIRDRLEKIITSTTRSSINKGKLRKMMEYYNTERRRDTNALVMGMSAAMEEAHKVRTLLTALFVYNMGYCADFDELPELISFAMNRQKVIEDTRRSIGDQLTSMTQPYSARDLVPNPRKNEHMPR